MIPAPSGFPILPKSPAQTTGALPVSASAPGQDLLKGKLTTIISYRKVKFDYVSSNSKLNQNIGGLDFSYQFNKKLYFAINFETTIEKEFNYNRVYLNLRKKF